MKLSLEVKRILNDNNFKLIEKFKTIQGTKSKIGTVINGSIFYRVILYDQGDGTANLEVLSPHTHKVITVIL